MNGIGSVYAREMQERCGTSPMITGTGNVPSADKKVGQIEIAINNLESAIYETQNIADRLNSRLDVVVDRTPEVANVTENAKRPPMAPLAEKIASLFDKLSAVNAGLSYLIRKIEV